MYFISHSQFRCCYTWRDIISNFISEVCHCSDFLEPETFVSRSRLKNLSRAWQVQRMVYIYDFTFSIQNPTAGLHKMTALPINWCCVISICAVIETSTIHSLLSVENWSYTCYFIHKMEFHFDPRNTGSWQNLWRSVECHYTLLICALSNRILPIEKAYCWACQTIDE